MVSHLGRHSTVQGGAAANVTFLRRRYGCLPADLLIWLSPSVAQPDYRLDYFDLKDNPQWQRFFQQRKDGFYLDIAGFNQQAFLDAGVTADHIERSPINTATSPHYPSHRQGDTERFAIVAMMKLAAELPVAGSAKSR